VRGAVFQKLHSLRIFIFCAALILDRVTKFCAGLWLLPGFATRAATFPSLRLYHNYGVTFSLLRGYPMLCAALSLAAVASLLFVCVKNKTIRSMHGVVFLFAGALGNLTDRLMYGYVVDWIYVGGYINLADVWIGVGCLMICAQFIRINRGRFLQ
jgi:signal peptidase II